MPPRKSRVGAAAPFKLLCQQIASALKGNGSIELPDSTIKRLKGALKPLQMSKTTREIVVPDSVITKLLSLLDEPEGPCNRLEATTFLAVLDTLLNAGYSRLKERGILLLAASLHHDRHGRVRNAAVGKECLQSLLSCFTNTMEDAKIRKWIGVLTLLLLEESEEFRSVLELGPEENKRKLGPMIIEEKNEILRITCGQLLKALIAWKIPLKDFWPVGTDSRVYSGFPASSQNGKHWSNAFQAYLDQLFYFLGSLPGNGNIYFAQAVRADPLGFCISGCTISVLIDHDVSIFTQSSGGSFDQSLEIPFHLISNVKFMDTILDGAIEIIPSPVDVVVSLHDSEVKRCYVNATPEMVKELQITVGSRKIAEDLGAELLVAAEGLRELKASQTRETIVIVPRLNGLSGQGGDHSSQESGVNHTSGSSQSENGKSQSESAPVVLNEDGGVVELRREFPLITEGTQDNSQTQHNQPSSTPKIAELRLGDTYPVLALPNEEDSGEQQDSRSSAANVSFHTKPPSDPHNEPNSNIRASPDEEAYDPDEVSAGGLESSHGAPPSKIIAQSPVLESIPPESSLEEDTKELSEDPNYSPSPITKPLQKTNKVSPETKIKSQMDVNVAKSKSNAPNGKIYRTKKPGLKPKDTIKTYSTKSASGLVAKVKQKAIMMLPAIGEEVQMTKLAKWQRHPSPNPMAECDPLIEHGEDTGSEPAKAETNGTTNMDLYNTDPLAASCVTKQFAGRLSELLVGIDDMDQLSMSSKAASPTAHTEKSFGLAAVEVKISTPSPSRKAQLPTQEDKTSLGRSATKKVPARLQKSSTRTRCSPHLVTSRSGLPRTAPEEQIFRSRVVAVEGSASPLRRSARLLVREEALSFAHSATKKKITKHQKSPPTPRRRIPRLMVHEKDTSVGLSVVLTNKPLVDTHLARKTPLVGFDARGPMNQGLPSLKKPRISRYKGAEKSKTDLVLIEEYKQEHEKKRNLPIEETTGRVDVKRPRISKTRKVQITAPCITEDSPLMLDDTQNPILTSGPLVVRHASGLPSQGSRVDENGSPRASNTSLQQRGKYNAIVRKVLKDASANERNVCDETKMCLYTSDDDGLPAVFGPQPPFLPNDHANASSNAKPRPPYPHTAGKVASRYVPHKRTISGEDEEVKTKRILAQQCTLPDPFHERKLGGKCIDFAQRLQFREPENVQVDKPGSPQLQRRIVKRTAQTENPEATLVGFENDVPIEEVSSPTDLASESSDDSVDQRPSRESTISVDEGLDVEWRKALKPHQKGVLEALYQVSNDLVRYLVSHEEAIKDLLADYLQGGTRLVEALEKDHNVDKRRIHNEFDAIKKGLDKSYKESQIAILQTAKDIRTSPVRDVEKGWMQQQEVMKRLVTEGRRWNK